VLDHARLGWLFAPETLAELPIAAPLDAMGGAQAFGVVDRLVVAEGVVTVVDFKTNRVVPADSDKVPEGLLRQMAAYGAMLAQVFPDHRIDCAILWTRTAELMPLPSHLLDAALRRAATS